MPKPFIKWPGGKGSEIEQFLPLIPDYDRYIEPFVGGGALYFYLNPEKAVINDTSEGLMDLYRLAQKQDPELHRIMVRYCRSFGALKQACSERSKDLTTLYRLYEFAAQQELDLKNLAIYRRLVEDIALEPSVTEDLILERDDYMRIMYASVEDKIRRTVKNNLKKEFSAADLRRNLQTGFLSGYYLYQREIMNEIASGKLLPSLQFKTANFFFIREYCYGSMFRYNSSGEFNIPYGGISYNKKDLSEKIERIFSPQTASLLKRTQIYCDDFEKVLNALDLTERDFLFLDPPYDTEFSDYEGRDFSRDDQTRLEQFLEQTSAQFLLVIKNTDFIYHLYEGKFRILAFENRYLYNVRSRNDRHTEHLIITNIPEGTVPWIRENVER